MIHITLRDPDEMQNQFACDNCGEETVLNLRESIKQERDPYMIPYSECDRGILEELGVWTTKNLKEDVGD